MCNKMYVSEYEYPVLYQDFMKNVEELQGEVTEHLASVKTELDRYDLMDRCNRRYALCSVKGSYGSIEYVLHPATGPIFLVDFKKGGFYVQVAADWRISTGEVSRLEKTFRRFVVKVREI